ncbi:MAG: four helix bundle protein [Phycisphaerales bacterium]|jgi:four helix bundle protein|nr:four helix bundle protein [Phycisphaerales bacterium]
MSKSIQSYRDLVAWQRARELVRLVYQLTGNFPGSERFGLVSQMRRAAVGVLSNIAEGYGRGSRPDYLRFLRIARGSLFELESQAIVSVDLGFLAEEQAHKLSVLVDEVAKPLSGLIRVLEK